MVLFKPTGYGGSIHFQKESDEKSQNVLTISKDNLEKLDHPEWAPTWDPRDDHAFEHIAPFKHVDRGFFGDPTFKHWKDNKNITLREVSPNFGLEVDGIQLSNLTDKQKDDLALLVEKRGVIAFKNQDFKYQSFEEIKAWGKYFGPLHIHPTSGAPLNQPEFHMTFRRGSKEEQQKYFHDRLNNILWHSDITYDNQLPGITLFAMLQTGVSGGDTQFLDMFEIYDRLSPLMKDKLEGLMVLHSSRGQADSAIKSGSIQRKDVIDSIHPLIRYHPVLKRKFLFLNRVFATRILGLKTEESNDLMLFLIKHIESCLDAHVRFNWDANTVVVWDNRRVLHTATNDWESDDIRHAFRVTTLAERPVGSEEEYNNWTPEKEIENINLTKYVTGLNATEYYERFIEKK